jgi:hypothetical protein
MYCVLVQTYMREYVRIYIIVCMVYQVEQIKTNIYFSCLTFAALS